MTAPKLPPPGGDHQRDNVRFPVNRLDAALDLNPIGVIDAGGEILHLLRFPGQAGMADRLDAARFDKGGEVAGPGDTVDIEQVSRFDRKDRAWRHRNKNTARTIANENHSATGIDVGIIERQHRAKPHRIILRRYRCWEVVNGMCLLQVAQLRRAA